MVRKRKRPGRPARESVIVRKNLSLARQTVKRLEKEAKEAKVPVGRLVEAIVADHYNDDLPQ